MKLSKLQLSVLICLILYQSCLFKSFAQGLPEDFNEELVVSGLGTATDLKQLPNGKIIVTEKSGKLYLVDPNNVSRADFMELNNVESGFERGLLSILLDPDFESNNHFYLFYTTTANKIRISRFTILDEIGDLNSETIIWESDHVYVPGQHLYHYGGAMDFANDGTLFFCTGDMLEENKTQDLQEEHGKLMRINKDGSIPIDNPFYNDGAALGPNGELPEIYAWGLRNPFKGYYDKLSDTFIIAEVGGNDASSSWEDIHFGKKRANYGWPDCGESGRNEDGSCQDPTLEDPIFTYPHIVGRGHSITGGFIYRNGNFPTEYQGVYFYTDYAQSWIRYLKLDQNMMPIGNQIDFKPATGLKGNVAMIQGDDGAIYYLDINDFTDGKLFKIKYIGPEVPIITQASATPINGSTNQEGIITGKAPLEVSFEGDAFIENGSPLTFSWDFGDGNSSDTQNVNYTYNEKGAYKARLTVSNSDGLNAFSDEINIVVGEPPIVNITSPTDGSTFLAGEQITFSGTAEDDDPLNEDSYSWNIVFLHNDHTHPGISDFNSSTGIFNIPIDGHSFQDNTGFIFSLTVTDADGISTTESITIFPQKSNITLNSEPSGLVLNVANQPRTTPYVVGELIGFEAEITAISPQALDNKKYVFKEWSNGGTRTQLYKNPETNSTLTAIFEEVESSFLEVEDNYEVVADVADLDIRIVFSDFVSQSRAIGIFNPGDIIRVPIDLSAENSTSTAGKYIINVRVRSGSQTVNDTFWPDGYKFRLNSEPITLIGDPNSIAGPSGDVGGAHWGTMISDEVTLSEGIHYLEVEAVNGFGVVDYVELVKVSNDIPSTPELSLSSNTDRTVTISWLESTDADGIDFYEIYQDGALIESTIKTKYTIDQLFPGTAYDFTVRAVDRAGSPSELSNVLSVTTAAPMEAGIIITSPDSGEEVTGPDVEIAYSVFGDPTSYDHVIFQLDDNPIKYAHDLDGGIFLFTNVPPGIHEVTAFISMGHGTSLQTEEALKTVTFEVVYSQNVGENAGVVITSPKNQDRIFTNTVDIDYTLYGDQSTFSALQITVDQMPPLKVTDLTGSYTLENLSVGSHEIMIRLLDDADEPLTNPEASTSVAFKVFEESDIPTIEINSPGNNESIFNNDVLVEYTISGNNTLFEHLHLKLDDQDYIPVYNMTGTYLLEGLALGQHTLQMYLVDSHHAPLHYPQSNATVTFTVKNSSDAPRITITDPTNNGFIYGNEMEIKYEISGETDDLDHIHFYLNDLAYQADYSVDGTFTLKNISEGANTLVAHMAKIQHQLFPNSEASDTITFNAANALSVPSGFSGNISADYNGISLSWETIPGNVIYQLEVAENVDGPFTELANIKNSNIYEHKIPVRGPDYYYRIKAEFGNLSSDYSDVIKVITNQLPIAKDFSVSTNEDNAFTFSKDDFKSNFIDGDLVDSLVSIFIVSLPDTGVLELNGSPVTLNQSIMVEDIAKLEFKPIDNWFGETSFMYKVSDGIVECETARTITLSVSPVNDAPFNLSLSSESIEENNILGAEIATISVEDIDNNTHTYSIVNKILNSDIFRIEGNKLTALRIFDYELQNSYTLELEANDRQGGKVSKVFEIEIIDEIDEPLGLNEALKAEGIEVYPNPVSQDMVINMDNPRTGEYLFEIMDISGKILYNETVRKANGRDSFKLELDFLNRGIYILKLTHATNSLAHKFFKN